jgi:hypothetical protein
MLPSLLVLPTALFAQVQPTGMVEGQVFRLDSRPHVGLVVELTTSSESPGSEKKSITSTVDEKGNYTFSGLVPGKYVLSASVKSPSTSLENAPCYPSNFVATTPKDFGLFAATARTADGQVVQVFVGTIEVKSGETLRVAIGPPCK